MGKQQKETEKKTCESKVLAILLKQFALQKSFINMTKAKQMLTLKVYTYQHSKSCVGQKKIDKRLQNLGFFKLKDISQKS